MSIVNIYGGYGAEYKAGSPIYIRDGNCLYNGREASGNTYHAQCTIEGNQVYLGQSESGVPICTVDGDTVYVGHGGGAPLFKIVGNRAYDGYGGGAPVLTASSDDVMALAAAACLTRKNDILRYGGDRREANSVYRMEVAGKNEGDVIGVSDSSATASVDLNRSMSAWDRIETENAGNAASSYAGDPYEDMLPIDKEIYAMFPWYYNAAERSTPARNLPVQLYAHLPPEETPRQRLRRHSQIGANYSDKGVVKAKWELCEQYPILEDVESPILIRYYDHVPSILTHDEFMYECKELEFFTFVGQKNRKKKEAAKIEQKREAKAAEEERLKTAVYHFFFDGNGIFNTISAMTIFGAYILSDGVFYPFAWIGIVICAVLLWRGRAEFKGPREVRWFADGYDSWCVDVHTGWGIFWWVILAAVLALMMVDQPDVREPVRFNGPDTVSMWTACVIHGLALVMIATAPKWFWEMCCKRVSARWHTHPKRFYISH
jgi:hypothetical protein